MSGADHRRDLPLAQARIGDLGAKGPKRRRSAMPQRRLDRFGRGKIERIGAVLILDPGPAQLLAEPALAVAAPAERLGLGQSEGRIVDQPERTWRSTNASMSGGGRSSPSRARAACAPR